jgi:hypothetical protein
MKQEAGDQKSEVGNQKSEVGTFRYRNMILRSLGTRLPTSDFRFLTSDLG